MYRNFLQGKATYIRPFASPDNYECGKHAAYSISLYLVERCKYEDNEHAVAGSDCEEDAGALELEERVFEEFRIKLDAKETELLRRWA